MKLTIGTCQFPVSKDIKSNTRYVLRQMKQGRKNGAEVVSFSEAALSGYAGCEFPTFEGYDWPLLERCTQQVMDLAKELKLWVVLGSSHRLTDKLKAHNSHYIINDRGRIIDRYDKMFCAGNRSEKNGRLRELPGGRSLLHLLDQGHQVRRADLPRLSLPGNLS